MRCAFISNLTPCCKRSNGEGRLMEEDNEDNGDMDDGET